VTFDVLIVGAGPVGASLACAASGLSVALAGREPAASVEGPFDPRVYALSPGNVAFLREIDVWARIPAGRVVALRGMRVYGDDRQALLQFDAYRSGVSELAWMVEHRALQGALAEKLASSPHVHSLPAAACEGLRTDASGITLRLRNGEHHAARLLVGADGADSFVREQAGVLASEWAYGQSALVANFACEKAHDDVALQWFQGGPVLALLPLPGQHVSMVWSLPSEEAERLERLEPALLCREVEAASGSYLGTLAVVTPPRRFPLRRLRARPMIAPRVALVGDAAHVVHPLAGQGLNLGLQDARELAKVLSAPEAARDPGERRLLRRYERARAEPLLLMDSMVDGLYTLFASQGGAAARLRNSGLRLVERLPMLKNLLVRQAMS
jgi:ubiquinone biosynthesis UbiH/UbiF/VisC/COQ6 family hydroxylase